jgi:hypothetical protein
MGEVYLAQHPRLPRPLKIFPPSLTDDRDFRKRLAPRPNSQRPCGTRTFLLCTIEMSSTVNWIAIDYVEGTVRS